LSVGVKEKDLKFLRKIASHSVRIDCLTIDIAHGFSVGTEKAVNNIKDILHLKMPFIIAGNVFGDEPSIRFLEDLGVDAIKVGLAFGKACITYNQTGFASPMFSSGKQASNITKLPLIGDGGIRENGDITKGLVAGYTMLMAGSIFAQCINSPAPTLGNGNKVYFGSASELGNNKQNKKYIEGKAVEMPCNLMTYEQKLNEIEQNMRSSVSYAGGKDLTSFNTVKWREITK
jgi:GMP reductase